MTQTRTQTGKTPKKTEHPGFVPTPGTYKRTSRKSGVSLPGDNRDAPFTTSLKDETIEVAPKAQSRTQSTKSENLSNGVHHATNGHAKAPRKSVNGHVEKIDPKVDRSGEFEFGGSVGTTAMMVGFPMLMYYMWIGATYYDGHFPTPAPGETSGQFFRHLGHLVYTGAFPHLKAWAMYWIFFVFEMALYCLAPGVWAKGKPLPHENGQMLDYYCSGLFSWYVTIATSIALHFSGLFKLDTIIDEFGPLLSVAIISGFGVAIIAYFSALARGKEHRMTGYPIYDFFMGAELNPRMFGILDFKMFFEVRLPWFILFLLTLGACARQYERYGYVPGELGLLLMAHWLYANACAKAEELIVTTWDMYYEKWGFMLIFWNMAGVPLSYCHCTIYLANHDPKEYAWNKYALASLYVAYLFVYWVWDSANAQKNRYRASETGTFLQRKAFPEMPWATLKDPKVIQVEGGGTILADGWYGYARKIHYSCDLFFALSWAGVTGFHSPFPWFYPLFFAGMITHRATRDIEKCRKRYGKAWVQYEEQVPYLFIPYVF